MKHLEVTDIGGKWVLLISPTFQKYEGKKTPFGIVRELYSEWRQIEKKIIENGLYGWVCDTEIDNWPMIRFITSGGGKPYKIDVKNKAIWFLKQLTED